MAACRHLCLVASGQRSGEGREVEQELLSVCEYLSPCAALLPAAVCCSLRGG